jgi:hypothetical protein
MLLPGGELVMAELDASPSLDHLVVCAFASGSRASHIIWWSVHRHQKVEPPGGLGGDETSSFHPNPPTAHSLHIESHIHQMTLQRLPGLLSESQQLHACSLGCQTEATSRAENWQSQSGHVPAATCSDDHSSRHVQGGKGPLCGTTYETRRVIIAAQPDSPRQPHPTRILKPETVTPPLGALASQL